MKYQLSSSVRCVILPRACVSITTLETVRLLDGYGAILGVRQFHASRGLTMGATLVESGYVGLLKIQVTNTSNQQIEISKGEKILNLLPVEVPDGVCYVRDEG